MKLYDKDNNIYTAHKVKKPRMKVIGLWNTTTISVDGVNTTLWNYMVIGNSEYFELNGDWYKIVNEHLADAPPEFLDLFTKKNGI